MQTLEKILEKKGVFDFYRSKNNKLKIKYRG
jgi:hypothetical protein